MVGPEDVALGVMSRLQITTARIALPGGLWYGRVNEQATAPYGRLVVKSEDPKRISDGRYHRRFTVQISVWADTGPGPGGDLASALTAIEGMMPGLIVATAIKVVDVKPGANELEVEASPRKASDVCLGSREWSVLIEGR